MQAAGLAAVLLAFGLPRHTPRRCNEAIAVEKLAGICFFLFGISHIVQPRAWAGSCVRHREKGTAGSFINGWIHFPFGALIVAFHNVWHGVPAILTVLGYAWVIKRFIYFVFPRHGLKVMQRVRVERAWSFVVVGVAIVSPIRSSQRV